jgi:two-component system nitrate/nitrite response regulator NarL
MFDSLTNREKQIADLISCGLSNKEVCRQLGGIAEGTVKIHLHNIYAKTNLRNRTTLAIAWALSKSTAQILPTAAPSLISSDLP